VFAQRQHLRTLNLGFPPRPSPAKTLREAGPAALEAAASWSLRRWSDFLLSRNNLMQPTTRPTPLDWGLKPSTASTPRYRETMGSRRQPNWIFALIEQRAQAQGLRPPPPRKAGLLATTQSSFGGGDPHPGHRLKTARDGHEMVRNVNILCRTVARCGLKPLQQLETSRLTFLIRSAMAG